MYSFAGDVVLDHSTVRGRLVLQPKIPVEHTSVSTFPKSIARLLENDSKKQKSWIAPKIEV